MREIKFRAWDGEEMCYFPTLFKMASGNQVAYDSSGNRYSLMQFTGLQDKNGIDLYEGDIFQAPSTINKEYHGDWIRNEVIIKPGMVIASHISSEKGKLPRGYAAGPLLDSWFEFDMKLFLFSNDYEPRTEIEIIGNIHQNPELLER